MGERADSVGPRMGDPMPQEERKFLWVVRTRSLCSSVRKTAEPIEMPFGGYLTWAQRNMLDESIRHREGVTRR